MPANPWKRHGRNRLEAKTLETEPDTNTPRDQPHTTALDSDTNMGRKRQRYKYGTKARDTQRVHLVTCKSRGVQYGCA